MMQEEFTRWAMTEKIAEQAEKDEDRYWMYLNTHKAEIQALSQDNEKARDLLTNKLFRATRVENLMQMSVQEVLALPEEMLD